jgi:hypothetical protein
MSRQPARTVRFLFLGVLPCLLIPAAALAWHSGSPAIVPGPQAQAEQFSTPTPGPDGRIVYIMQEGDTLWTIAALSGISLEELLALNGIQPSDAGLISPGTRLQLGLAGPVVPTTVPGSTAAPTAPLPSPTAITGSGEICILLFLDGNGDGRWQEDELPLAGGQVSVADASGAVVGERTTEATVDLDPVEDSPIGHCFPDLPFGDYNVSGAVPPDHNPTTAMNIGVSLAPGETKHVSFGAQPSGAFAGGIAGGQGRSALLGLVGLSLILGAGGLAFYASRLGRRRMRGLR